MSGYALTVYTSIHFMILNVKLLKNLEEGKKKNVFRIGNYNKEDLFSFFFSSIG